MTASGLFAGRIITQLTSLGSLGNTLSPAPCSQLHANRQNKLQRRCNNIVSRSRRHSAWQRTAAAGRSLGPSANGKPEWLKILEEDADDDPDIKSLLDGADGDQDLIEERMRRRLQGGSPNLDNMYSEKSGSEEQMQVVIREVDPFNLWLWVEMREPPVSGEDAMIEEVLTSWFMIGRFGGFNGMNLQLFNNASDEGASYAEYDAEECETGLDAFFHDISETETRGNWIRAWVNMGTADELALDVLVNTLSNFSRERAGIKQFVIGGENDDWNVPEMQLPKGSMDPMQTNVPGWDDMDPDDY